MNLSVFPVVTVFAFAKSVSVFNSLTRLSRVISVISTFALLFNSSFAGVWSASESLCSAIASWQRGRPGHFTDVPQKPNLGTKHLGPVIGAGCGMQNH